MVNGQYESDLHRHLKVLSGITAFVILGIFLLKYQNSPSTITLTSDKNRFNINFTINKNDTDNARLILQRLNLPQDVLNGTSFQLDRVSTAKLAFSAPININLKFIQKKLDFTGRLQEPFQLDTYPLDTSYKIPTSTTIAIFAKDLKGLVEKKFNLSGDLKQWFDQNINSDSGEYFETFGTNDDFVLALIPRTKVQLEGLSNIKMGDIISSSYKQETEGDTVLHIIKISESEATLTLFEINDWLYVTTTTDAARQIINIQKNQAQSFNFPVQTTTPINLTATITNTQSINSNTLKFLVDNPSKILPQIQQLKDAQIILSGTTFTGFLETR